MNRARARRPGAALVVALVGLVALAACSTVRGLLDTERALERAGYTQVDVGFSSANGFDQVEVGLVPAPTELSEVDADDEAERAAEVVWTVFPLRFDLLRIELLESSDGAVSTFTYGEMDELFGPRDPALDEKALGDDVVRTGVGIAVVLAVGGLLFLGALVLAVVLIVRASRRRKGISPPPWPPAAPSDRES